MIIFQALLLTLDFLSHKFATCSKPSNVDNDHKAPYLRCNNLTKVQVEPKSFDQNCHGNDSFTCLATLQMICYNWLSYFANLVLNLKVTASILENNSTGKCADLTKKQESWEEWKLVKLQLHLHQFNIDSSSQSQWS